MLWLGLGYFKTGLTSKNPLIRIKGRPLNTVGSFRSVDHLFRCARALVLTSQVHRMLTENENLFTNTLGPNFEEVIFWISYLKSC